MVLFILGVLFIGIAPIFISALFQKKTDGNIEIKNSNNLIIWIILANIVFFFLRDKNTDILFGTLLGSCLFQLLVIGGVNQLFSNLRGNTDGRGQYLAFCIILILFLAADYLLTGNASNNILNRVDGVLLIFLFFLYSFFRIRNEMGSALLKNSVLSYMEKDSDGKGWGSVKTVVLFIICQEAFILAGAYLIAQSAPKLGAMLGIPQYLTGFTIVAWCVNFSSILLPIAKNQKINYMEKAVEGSIITITLLLGIASCILQLSVSSYMVYDLILFGLISVGLCFIQKIDRRLAASSMATAYIAFVVYVFIR